VELHQLKPAVAVRGPHHRDVDSDAVDCDDAVRPTRLRLPPRLQLQTKFDKESDSSCKTVDNSADDSSHLRAAPFENGAGRASMTTLSEGRTAQKLWTASNSGRSIGRSRLFTLFFLA
jgi:hypothetical protein